MERSQEARRARDTGIGLGVLLLLLVVYLAAGDNPINDGIAERIRDGDPVRSVDYAVTYGWPVAVVNALVVALLLRTRTRWLGPVEAPTATVAAPPASTAVVNRVFGAVVLASVLALAVLAAPRLSYSLWGDEEWTVRRAIDGAYAMRDGRAEFQRVGWRETFFDYRKPSNHVGFTVLSRLSLAGWRTAARPELEFVSETAVRLPAYLAGLGAVVAVALLLRRMGQPLAGALAATALSLHPWLVRYASEARGYAFLVLLVPLLVWLLLRALERGSWPRWLLFGFAQFLLVWTWPPMAITLIVLNAAAVLALAGLYGSPRTAPVPWTRWALACTAAGLLFLQLMLGALVQLGAYVERESLPFDRMWFVNLGGHLLAGVSYGPDRPDYHDLVEVASVWPRTFPLWAALTGLAALLGVAAGLLAGRVRALCTLALLLPGPILVGFAVSQGSFLNHWYLLFALPGLAIFLATGLTLPARWEGTAPRAVAFGLCALWLAGFVAFTTPAREALRGGSLQPMRESVAITRPLRDPNAPENERILTVAIQRPPDYYDPRVEWVLRPEALYALMRRADAEGLPLWVNTGRPGLARKRVPELVALIEDADLFTPVARLPGFEPRGVRLLYRYRRGSIDQADSGRNPAPRALPERSGQRGDE
ncbi:MAG: glycosyltransferase family 39 protein [Myxococcota bacterium]|nr:glycosyltransferase family 39 protein [Myxococcota bacterium]